jgi:hypothetical protein
LYPAVATLVRGFIVNGERASFAMQFERSAVIDLRCAIDVEVLLDCDQEAIRNRYHSLDHAANWRVKYECFVLTTVLANDHLAVISADQYISSVLRPGMAREVLGDLAALLHIVDLGVFGHHIVVEVLLDELECVAWASQQELVALDVEGVE